MSSTETQRSVRWPWVWFFSLLPFIGWWLTGLFDLDEGFYGAVVAEMNRRGEWITPYFNGHPWFEKPVLTYWITKPCLWLCGDVVGPRLPSVVATVATFGVVAWFGRRRFSDGTAARVILILATSLLFVALGRMLMTDPLLDLTLVAAFLTFWESLVGDFRWRWATAACLGLAVLAKGPVALLLFLPLALWTFLREPQLRANFNRGWFLGTIILAATISCWYVPAYIQNGQIFVQKFLIEQNLQRFAGGDAAHTLNGVVSSLFFVPVLLVGMAPWSVWLFQAWPRRLPGSSDPTEALRRYLAAWASVVFVFFTLSGAKLVHYVLPCCVPIAFLVADFLNNAKSGAGLKGYYAGAVAMCALVNVAFVAWYRISHQNEIHGLARELRKMALPSDRIVVYQMPRREKSMGTGELNLRETSEPSVLLYLNRTVLEAESLEDPTKVRRRFWILTRSNRIADKEAKLLQMEGWELRQVATATPQSSFALWAATPLTTLPDKMPMSPAPAL